MSMGDRVDAPEEVALLDTAQAAAYLNVTPRLIRRFVEERRVTVCKVGRFNRFRKEDLEAIIKLVPARASSEQAPLRPLSIEGVEDDDPIMRLVTGRRDVTRASP